MSSSGPSAQVHDDPRWLRRLIAYCLTHRSLVVLAFGGAAGVALISAAVPLVIRHVIDNLVSEDGAAVWPWVGVLVAAGLAQYGLSFARRYCAGKLALNVQYDLRRDIFSSLSQMDGAAQDSLDTGQVVSRAVTDISLVQGLLMFIPNLASNVLLFTASLVVMMVLSPVLTVVALLVAPALWFVARGSRRDLFPANWDAQQQAGEVVGHVEAAVTGVRVVKGFGQEHRELAELADRARTLFAKRLRVVRLQAKYAPTLAAIPSLGQVGVLMLGGWLALHGQITLGTFLAFSTYLGQLVAPVRQVTALLTIGQQARAGVERVLEVIDGRPGLTDSPDATEVPTGELGVEFAGVSFAYPDSPKVLDDLTLNLHPGETVAVVGGAGSGKSTLAQLIARFYDVTDGAVRVGHTDVRSLRASSLRRATGFVFEESFLFSDTIGANIAFGRPDSSDEEIRAAARTAQADGFISALPEGYDTMVGERGLTLSGGQRQRLALARALLVQPRLLVLDDATSAIDPGVEGRIIDALRVNERRPTTLLIAHRRSSLTLADRIVVLEHGRIVESGSLEELEQHGPAFTRLFSPDAHSSHEQPDRPGTTNGAGPRATLVRPDGARPGAAAGAPARPLAVSTGSTAHGKANGGGVFGSVPATPALTAAVDALPPATGSPDIDDNLARAADPAFGLRRLIRPVRVVLAAGLAIVGLDAVAQLIVPALVRTGIDRGVTTGSTSTLAALSLLGLGVVGLDWVVSRIGQLVTGRTGERLLYLLRVKTFAHLQRLGLDYYEREPAGRIMTRMTTDVDALSNFLQTGLTTMVVSLLTLLGVLVALIALDAQLSLVLVAMLPVLGLGTWLFRTHAVPAYHEARNRISVVNASFQESVSGLRVTQAFGREDRNTERFLAQSRDYLVSRLRAQRYIATFFPFVALCSDVAAALVLGFGAGLLRSGGLTAGALIAFFLYLDAFFTPVQQLSQVFDGYQQSSIGLDRLRELLRTPTSTPASEHPQQPRRGTGDIDFEAVRFRYPGADVDAVGGLTLHIAGGETVALVGQTGAGKSSVVKLCARFYDPTEGSVLVDGQDLRELDLARYRGRIGLVPQEPYLSDGTVRAAIAYGRPDAGDAQIVTAAQSVGAHETICALRGGYDHQVGERGNNLSAGQRQLVALARAELVQPDILLLDEATAALDLASEAVVTRATRELTRTRTTLVVAHRLTTAARADRIVVLDQGRVVESGSHQKLLAAGGAYAALWQSYSDRPIENARAGEEVTPLRRAQG